MRKFYCVSIFLISILYACDSSIREVQQGEVVTIYSNTFTSLDQSLFAAFEHASGVKVNINSESAPQIINRLTRQQQDSMQADLVVLEGIAYLQQAKEAGLFDTLSQGSIINAIPAYLRDSDLQWLGLGYSVNVMGYLRDSVDTLQIMRYADLADPKWKNKLGLGTRKKAIYQSQLASMLADRGETATAEWLNGISNNRIDTNSYRSAKLFTIADTSAWLSLLNTAEYAKNQNRNSTAPGLIFPNPEAYLHITGVGIVQGAPHPARARLLLNYMFSREIMQQYANIHYLYPVRPDIDAPASLSRLGKFRADTTSQSKISRLTSEAERMLNSIGWR